jgi:hypothetical protein
VKLKFLHLLYRLATWHELRMKRKHERAQALHKWAWRLHQDAELKSLSKIFDHK